MATEETKSFSDITGISLGNISQLRLFKILKDWDGTDFWNIWRTYSLNPDALEKSLEYEIYQVQEEDWWENISYKLYGTVNFWWLLCLINGVNNPFEELIPGTSIKIINSTYLYQLIKEIKAVSTL